MEDNDSAVPTDVARLAQWLRNERASKLSVEEAVLVDKRVDCFTGEQLLAAIREANTLKHPEMKRYASLPPAALTELADRLFRAHQFVRVAPLEENRRRRAEETMRLRLHPSQSGFASDGEYAWTIPRSQKAALASSLAMIAGIIFLCCFKIWPIWLRIVIWWISLILLITQLTLLALHLGSGVFFFLIGFRQMRLFPNLFDDDAPFFQTFSPVLGRTGSYQALVRAARESKRKQDEAKGSTASNKGNDVKTAAPTPTASSTSSSSSSSASSSSSSSSSSSATVATASPPAEGAAGEGEEKPSVWSSWQFGLVNVAFVLLVGLWICNLLGLFMPENVPDFVISTQELISMFPSLAPPPAAASAAEAAAGAAGAAAEAAAKAAGVA